MRINIPPTTRALLALTCFFTSLYVLARWNAPTATTLLTLVPARFYIHPWTIVTSTFVEQDIVNLLINTTAVYFSGRYLERAWGSKDFATVVIIATIIPNLLLIPTYVIWGFIFSSTKRAETPIAGAITLQAAFLVCFKQLVPEHTVSLYRGIVKVRVKHFPAMFLLLNTIGGFVFGTDTALLLAWYGLITTYMYLRFFRYQKDITTGENTIRGDASETFAFATFFPTVIQAPVGAVCDQIYKFACQLNLIRPFSDEAVLLGSEQAAGRDGILPTANHNAYAAAERRRQLALRALDERLQVNTVTEESPDGQGDVIADSTAQTDSTIK